MDLVSLYYFQELSKDLNMTRTAQRLYISQQTLSNHIHRLEQHYGCPLLYRKPTLSLTCAGEFVLSFAQVVEKEERNLEDILSDIEQQERGTLKLGAGTMRGAWILSQLLPDFHRRYPLVEVRFSDALSTQLEAMVSNGELDFAVVLSGSYSPDLLEQQLYQEQVYLCVPESLLRQYYSPDEVRGIKLRSLQGASVRDFARLPFALMDNRLGQRMREYFTREQVHPAVPFTGTATRHILPLCAQGMAACYCTQVGIVANAWGISSTFSLSWTRGRPLSRPCPSCGTGSAILPTTPSILWSFFSRSPGRWSGPRSAASSPNSLFKP